MPTDSNAKVVKLVKSQRGGRISLAVEERGDMRSLLSAMHVHLWTASRSALRPVSKPCMQWTYC